MKMRNAEKKESEYTIERTGSTLYLVCPKCLANIRTTGSRYPSKKRSASPKETSKASGKAGLMSMLAALGCTRRVMSLLWLMLMLMAFTVGGAGMFHAIEQPNEETLTIALRTAKTALLSRAYDLASELKYDEYLAELNQSLELYDEMSSNALKHGITSGQVEPRWSFRGAMFYCVTIFTTIGYGSVCPTTNAGRVLTIVYALIAIPLFLVIIGKMGRYLAKSLNVFYQYYHHFIFRFCGSCCAIDSSNPYFNRQTSTAYPKQTEPLLSRVDSKSTHASFSTSTLSEEMRVGPVVAILVVVAFMTAGTLMYKLWEPWTFLEAFYFVFISLSTIGFGDFVPSNPTLFLLSSLYLFLGLSLISMVINILVNVYSASYEQARDKLFQAKLCSLCEQ